MANRTFFDFVSTRGENVIESWLLNDIPKNARAAIEAQLGFLRTVPTFQRPAAGDMKGRECRGLIEIRVKEDRQQYRVLACYGPGRGEVTLLVGAREKDRKLEPRDACATARRRIAAIENGEGTIHERKR